MCEGGDTSHTQSRAVTDSCECCDSHKSLISHSSPPSIHMNQSYICECVRVATGLIRVSYHTRRYPITWVSNPATRKDHVISLISHSSIPNNMGIEPSN